ncbi:MAG TPA: MFS transporter [Tenuifilaceae bacterium]|jgi:fucose permease|nr:MFS transporter [Bacteroidales bacterium]MDI9515675.1 MFS transporter [Bacteroidota bacterium]NLH56562.1 sugar MFS transporter [Rikenellaceae bacterium]OQC63238.1 MAG: L-fucose-proton symporter [Bacteroidetes bacterium ADurb.Bin008]HNV81282.1 MFS transporter [Tenuifilaceae bacterium]
MSRNKTLPIFLTFLAMGFGDVVGPLVSLVKESFEVSNFVASLMTTSGFIMFGILSIPLGVFQDKRGKKYVLSMGLTIALIGLIIPILFGMYGGQVVTQGQSFTKLYALFGSIFLLGAGATTLQVAGNPIMRDVSAEGKYSSNLSLAQSIKAIGSSLGFLVPPAVALWFGLDWTILFPMYALILLITLLWVNAIRIEEQKGKEVAQATLGSSLKLLGNPFVLAMVLGIFLYVGAEVSMSAQIPILMDKVYGIKGFGLWMAWGLFFLPIFIGRLTGAFILRKLKAGRFLVYSVLLSALGMAMLFFGNQYTAFTGIIMIGLGFANIFPLIFSITVDAMPERTNELSGLMVTAIVGGALIPPITGAVADIAVHLGFIVPAACILYILIISLKHSNK